MSLEALAWVHERTSRRNPETGRDELIDEPKLVLKGTAATRGLLVELCRRAEDMTHRAWVSRTRLAKWIMASPDTVDRAIDALIAQRLIFKMPSWWQSNGAQSSNVLVINVNGDYDDFNSLEEIAAEVDRRLRSMGDDSNDKLAKRNINPGLGDFVPPPQNAEAPLGTTPTPPSANCPGGGRKLPRGGPQIAAPDKEVDKEVDHPHPPQPPEQGPDAATAAVEGVEEIPDLKPEPPSPSVDTEHHRKAPQERDTAPTGPGGHAGKTEAPGEPSGSTEDPLRVEAEEWVLVTLSEKTPNAAMLSRKQAPVLIEDVLGLLHKGWTTKLITKQIGRLDDLRYRFRPVREKLAALAELDPARFAPAPRVVPAPRAPHRKPSQPSAAQQAARDVLKKITNSTERKATAAP